jgi:hypothetical protein
MSSNYSNHLSQAQIDERRRKDWQENDRRKSWPWVADSNDRRSGHDRRVPKAG